MFGAITYLPLFFQIVHGESPTNSGLQLLPLMAGLIICSTGSGSSSAEPAATGCSRSPAPRLSPSGLLLLSRMGIGTSLVLAALYMLVLGVGLGCVMQVLVLIVQNAVPYSELGVATSGATFFRSIGGSFGTAIFGAIFSNVLVGNLVATPRRTPSCRRAVELERHAGDPRQAAAGSPPRTSRRPTPSRSRRCS